jgi:HEAT repeat protein
MIKHEKHNVRWSALKSLMQIDFEEGCKAVDELINDPHPDVRKAALKTIELINLQSNT